MDIHSIRRQNFRRLIDNFAQGSVAEFGRKYGFTEARLSQLLSTTFRGGQNFGEKMARKIESVCDIATFSLDQIPDGYTGEVDAIIRPVKRPKPVTQEGEDAVRNFYAQASPVAALGVVKVTKSSSDTGYTYERQFDKNNQIVAMGIRTPWLEKKGFRWAGLIAVEVEADGMEPSLHIGDFVAVNTADQEPSDGGVFLVDYEGSIVVRRILRDGGQWWLSADNADQRRFPRKSLHAPSVSILGRVIRKETEFV